MHVPQPNSATSRDRRALQAPMAAVTVKGMTPNLRTGIGNLPAAFVAGPTRPHPARAGCGFWQTL